MSIFCCCPTAYHSILKNNKRHENWCKCTLDIFIKEGHHISSTDVLYVHEMVLDGEFYNNTHQFKIKVCSFCTKNAFKMSLGNLYTCKLKLVSFSFDCDTCRTTIEFL